MGLKKNFFHRCKFKAFPYYLQIISSRRKAYEDGRERRFEYHRIMLKIHPLRMMTPLTISKLSFRISGRRFQNEVLSDS